MKPDFSPMGKAQDDFRYSLEIIQTTVSHYRNGRPRTFFTPAACCRMASMLSHLSSRLMDEALEMVKIDNRQEEATSTTPSRGCPLGTFATLSLSGGCTTS